MDLKNGTFTTNKSNVWLSQWEILPVTRNLSLSILIFYLLLFLGMLKLILLLVIFVLIKITIHVSPRKMLTTGHVLYHLRSQAALVHKTGFLSLSILENLLGWRTRPYFVTSLFLRLKQRSHIHYNRTIYTAVQYLVWLSETKLVLRDWSWTCYVQTLILHFNRFYTTNLRQW